MRSSILTVVSLVTIAAAQVPGAPATYVAPAQFPSPLFSAYWPGFAPSPTQEPQVRSPFERELGTPSSNVTHSLSSKTQSSVLSIP